MDKMKHMVYLDLNDCYRTWEVLDSGTIDGYEYRIYSCGSHPTAYVKCDLTEAQEREIEVHGGITFNGKLKKAEGQWIGWDYAHYMDYTSKPVDSLLRDVYDKKYDTPEILGDVKYVITQLKEILSEE